MLMICALQFQFMSPVLGAVLKLFFNVIFVIIRLV